MMLRKVGVEIVAPQWGHVRGMATLKDISNKLKSVKNIQKITQSMKMVSAAKYARAERELNKARPYGAGANAFYDSLDVKPQGEKKTELVVALTSDRGLCGAVHSSISKTIKSEYQEKPANVDYKIICVGDKSKAQLYALCRKDFVATMKEIGKTSPTFEDGCVIADSITSSGVEYDSAKLYYNRFKSVVSYETKALPIFREDTVSSAEKFPVYDSVDADVLKMYMEFSLASQIFFALKECACSEQSSRMTAMDAASKNAGEMIEKLSLTYNRTRQAVITRELIEIISGASAL